MLRDLLGDGSGGHKMKRENDNYEDCVSLGRQESSTELSDPISKVRSPQTAMTAAILLKSCAKIFFLIKVFLAR